MLLLLFPALIFPQSSADTKLRSKTKFNNNWKFVMDDKAGFETVDFNDAAWRTLNLPRNWGVEGKFNAKNPTTGLGAFLPCDTGWYRKTFVLPN